MSAYSSLTSQLDHILAAGGIEAWSDRLEKAAVQFIVTTNDGKQHVWWASEAAAFYAGWCARGTHERQQRERASA